jgi:hypothetical protein
LLTPIDASPQRARRVAAYACFALCALGVLYGVYLIVPTLHS